MRYDSIIILIFLYNYVYCGFQIILSLELDNLLLLFFLNDICVTLCDTFGSWVFEKTLFSCLVYNAWKERFFDLHHLVANGANGMCFALQVHHRNHRKFETSTRTGCSTRRIVAPCWRWPGFCLLILSLNSPGTLDLWTSVIFLGTKCQTVSFPFFLRVVI